MKHLGPQPRYQMTVSGKQRPRQSLNESTGIDRTGVRDAIGGIVTPSAECFIFLSSSHIMTCSLREQRSGQHFPGQHQTYIIFGSDLAARLLLPRLGRSVGAPTPTADTWTYIPLTVQLPRATHHAPRRCTCEDARRVEASRKCCGLLKLGNTLFFIICLGPARLVNVHLCMCISLAALSMILVACAVQFLSLAKRGILYGAWHVLYTVCVYCTNCKPRVVRCPIQ